MKSKPVALSTALVAALVASLSALAICAYAHLPGEWGTPKSCQKSTVEQDLARSEIKHNAGPNVGGMGMFEYTINEDVVRGLPRRTSTVHPNVALWTPHGRLLGSDRGEFGGELVLSRKDDRAEKNPELLLRENIEDLSATSYGIVVTTGLAHMGYDRGAIYILNFKGSKPTVSKVRDLPSAVVSSWHSRDGNVLVNTRQGSYLVKSPAEIVPIRCPASSR